MSREQVRIRNLAVIKRQLEKAAPGLNKIGSEIILAGFAIRELIDDSLDWRSMFRR